MCFPDEEVIVGYQLSNSIMMLVLNRTSTIGNLGIA